MALSCTWILNGPLQLTSAPLNVSGICRYQDAARIRDELKESLRQGANKRSEANVAAETEEKGTKEE